MSLASGVQLGVYRVQSLLGAGGMGEVYRARDTRLERDVALKVLPELFAADPERRARFEREARVLAALNHPNIAAIYGFEESGSVHALVLELVEGETLAERIARGPLPLQETLVIGRQIADALDAAHENGLVHRDLKPANIKIGPDGTVKVLDFGLAKALDADAGRPGASVLPTLTSPAATRLGVILGTAAYMSPEQARGRLVDKRTDLWAFGCVLYEMLTARRPFEGDETTDVIARIIEREVDFRALPAATPAPIRRLLRRCLEKDRKRRCADAADARLDIEDALSGTTDAAGSPGAAAPMPSPRWRVALPWAMAAAAMLVAAVGFWNPWRTAPSPRLLRLSAELGVDASLAIDQGAAAILSPDGAVLAFTAQPRGSDTSRLYIRRLDQLQPVALSGTDGARNPVFSPDGQWIAFFAGKTLKKVGVSGGAVVTLCEAPNGRGGTWTDDGSIIFSPDNMPNVTLMRVPAVGGKPEVFSTLEKGEVTHRWPQTLPGGKAVLYTTAPTTNMWEEATLVAQPLPSGPRKVLVQGAYYGRYAPSGHLLFIRQGTLFAVAFDADRLEVTGQPVPVIEGVASSPAVTGGAQVAVGADGSLVYVSGQGATIDLPIAWMDRQGKTTTLRAMPSNWSNPVFSPDGTRLAVDIFDGKQSDVWVYDWIRDTLSRLTFDTADDRRPAWTPDGRRVAFSSKRGDGTKFNLYWQRADGTGEVIRLTESQRDQYPGSWHPDGRVLAFMEVGGPTTSDVMMLPLQGDEAAGWKPGTPTVFLNAPFNESTPVFSPDGRWLAYLSNEGGRNDLYVRPFPGPGGKWQVSNAAADDPMWSRTRPELFFAANPGLQMMVARYSVEGDAFRVDKPALAFDTRFGVRPRPPSRDIAIHPDGQRFAAASVAETDGATRQDKVIFVANFLEELRRLAPVSN